MFFSQNQIRLKLKPQEYKIQRIITQISKIYLSQFENLLLKLNIDLNLFSKSFFVFNLKYKIENEV
jgi:hypothetical protein